MRTKTLEIYQENIGCQNSFMNIVMALSKIKNILVLDINMKSKIIKLKYQDESLNNQDVAYMIECASLA